MSIPSLQPATGTVIEPLAVTFDAGQTVIDLDLAFLAVNAPTWAEFIVNAPTALSADISVNHYSQPRRVEGMKNTMIELTE